MGVIVSFAVTFVIVSKLKNIEFQVVFNHLCVKLNIRKSGQSWTLTFSGEFHVYLINLPKSGKCSLL